MEDLVFKSQHSLVVQSQHSTLGAVEVNGDGFGVGWYGPEPLPGRFRGIEPAWNDLNLREIAAHVRSDRIFAHVRAATGTPVQQTNCHPFQFGRWLWMHNGSLTGFHRYKRDLAFAVAEDLYPEVQGSTDSELLFYLALTFGLAKDPPRAVARAVGLVEETARRAGVLTPVQMTVATTDGETTWAFRYSTEGHSRSLFHSVDMTTLRAQYPDHPVLHDLGADSRVVVSEPLSDLRGAWREVPEASCLVVRGGVEEMHRFSPLA